MECHKDNLADIACESYNHCNNPRILSNVQDQHKSEIIELCIILKKIDFQIREEENLT